ncbi:MAG: DegT/DnrJ/EryC1/StrS family aminotransferase, partial [Lachnospiraceae bacterium]|nr:DegT/DnrJ/EryC1/StrS family aminotransferase [Lachnospiraceae bacterium]
DYTGQSVELDQLLQLCHEKKLVLIEDGAHVIGTEYKGRKNGSIADMTMFSFHPVKTVTAGEGGAILTNSEEYYQKLLLYRAHGITRDERLLEHPSDGPWYYEQLVLGYNYRITDMQAALLISQLDKLEMFSRRRKEIVARYNDAFSKIPGIVVQKEIPESDTTRHLYILRIKPEAFSIDRRKFFDALEAENVCCNVHYIPTYYFPYYEKLGYRRGICPNAEKLYEEIITLPLYYAMSDADVESVIEAVGKIAAYYHL